MEQQLDLQVRQGRFVDYFGARLFIPRDHFDEEYMLNGGKPEQHVLTIFSRLVRPGDVVIDVGANIGTHSFALASLVGPEGRVYAVEADIDNAGALRASVVESRTTNIELLPVAAANGPGLIRALASRSTNSTFSTRALDGNAKVAVTLPLDDLITDDVALIKLDIEGAELLALQGLTHTIARSRPAVISEFSPLYIESTLGTDRSAEFFRYFSERDYDCFYIDPYGKLHATPDYAALLWTQQNASNTMSWTHIDLLFLPHERAEAKLQQS